MLLKIKIIINFKMFCVSIYILSSNKHKHLLTIASDLIKLFIEDFASIYGENYISYNVHNLQFT